MPTISMFYGILIRMFFYDTDKHHKPHIHAEYQGQVAVVVAWIEIHREDLGADWQLAANGRKPFPIRGLDQ